MKLDHSSASRICTKKLPSDSHTTSLSHTKQGRSQCFFFIQIKCNHIPITTAISFSYVGFIRNMKQRLHNEDRLPKYSKRHQIPYHQQHIHSSNKTIKLILETKDSCQASLLFFIAFSIQLFCMTLLNVAFPFSVSLRLYCHI